MSWSNAVDGVLKATQLAFGQTVTYDPTGADPAYSLTNAIFNATFQVVDPGAGFDVVVQKPALIVRLADLAAEPATGDRVTVGSRTYRLVNVLKDGQGGATLILQKVV